MAQATTMLAKADNGNTVEVRVGDTIVLRLYENSSTGFRWAFNGLNTELVELVELVGSEYLRESEAVGSGGYVRWTLAAKAAGTTQVKLKLWRNWEGDASIQERFAVTLQIRP